MRRYLVVTTAALMVLALAVGTVAATGSLWKAPPFSTIGVNNVYYIGSDFDVNPDPENAILRIWMETGSSSEKCLVTLGEANHSPAVDQIYCSSRGVTLDDGQVHWGVYVTLTLAAELVDVDGDPSWYSLNVYQEGARFFAAPARVECDDTHCFVF